MKMPSSPLARLLLVLLAAALAGCGRKEPAVPTTGAADAGPSVMEADLARTVAEQTDFYQIKTPADLPANLSWVNSDHLPEFANPNAKPGGTFRYYIADFPRTTRTIGPDATGGIRPYLLDYVGVPYVQPHPNLPGEVYAGLAESWAVEPSTRTVYFRLNPKATWSDGKPITAADVVFTFYFMRSPHLREPWYNDFYTKTYTAISVYDERTFAITLAEWKPDAVVRAGNLVPYARHAMQEFAADWIEKFQWRVLPTTGAYELLESNIERGRAVTLTKVKDWWARDLRFWRGRFNPDRYRLDVIRDPDKAFESFVRGDLDMFTISQPKFWYESLPDTHPEVAGGYIVKTKFFNKTPRPDWGLWINSSKPLLNQTALRQGLHHATNFDLVCEQYFRGDAVRMETRSDGYGWRMHPDIKARRFDPVKARELFAAAGFTTQGPDGVLMNAAGQRLSFTITTYLASLRDLLPILQQEALKAGLEYKLEVLDQTTGWKKVQEKQHEIALIALSRSVELYPRYWEMFHGSNAYEDAYLAADGRFVTKHSEGTPNPAPSKIRVQTNNMTMTFNPELDRLIEAYDRSETLDEIKRNAQEMEQIIHDQGWWVNGWSLPFHRTGYWRHVKWPEGFNAMQGRNAEEFFLHWVDEDERAATEKARRSGEKFPAQVLIFDQFNK